MRFFVRFFLFYTFVLFFGTINSFADSLQFQPKLGELLFDKNHNPLRILSPLGKGGLALVYKAKDDLGAYSVENLAIKFFKPDLSEYTLSQALRGHRLVQDRLPEHFHILPVYYVGSLERANDRVGFPSYRDVVITRREPETLGSFYGKLLTGNRGRGILHHNNAEERDRAIKLLDTLIDHLFNALDPFERAGLVHRDFKIDNIFINSSGNFVLGDFDLVVEEGENIFFLDSEKKLRTSGSPSYMAPEVLREFIIKGAQFEAASDSNDIPFYPANIRADYHAVGVIVLRLLSQSIFRKLSHRNHYLWGKLEDYKVWFDKDVLRLLREEVEGANIQSPVGKSLKRIVDLLHILLPLNLNRVQEAKAFWNSGQSSHLVKNLGTTEFEMGSNLASGPCVSALSDRDLAQIRHVL